MSFTHVRKLLLIQSIMISMLCGSVPAMSQSAVSCPVDNFRELMIVNKSVVEDTSRVMPGGPWHVSTLFRNMLPANADDAAVSRLIINWFTQWEQVHQVNGYSVTPRISVRNAILCPWLNASTGRTDCRGDRLNLALAPFRLLAIVNRMDKYSTGATDGGEGRFVFGALARPTKNPLDLTVSPVNLTVIFEYALPTSPNFTVFNWAGHWHRLGSRGFECTFVDCKNYKNELQQITNAFSGRGVAPGKPNGNSLNQMRTNEFLFGSKTWELREFKLFGTDTSVALRQVPLQQTPDPSLNGSEVLANLVTTQRDKVMNTTLQIPNNMLAGAVSESFNQEFKWRFAPSDNIDEEARFRFSSITCNGCHREESSRVPALDTFFHVSPHRTAGTDRVSTYLKTIALPERAVKYSALACPSTISRANFTTMFAPRKTIVH